MVLINPAQYRNTVRYMGRGRYNDLLLGVKSA